MSPRAPTPLAAPGPLARVGPVVAVLALALVVWQGSLTVPFVYDDFAHLVQNPGLQAPDASLATALRSGVQETRPLYNVTLLVLVKLGARSPLPFHVLALALHLCAVLLAYRLVRRLLPDRSPLVAALVASLFGLHPLQAETVCYVNSLSGLLAATLYLTALLGLAPGAPRRWPRLTYVLALLAGLGALLAKESAVTLPAAVLLLDLLFTPAGARAGLRRFTRRHWPVLVLPAVVLPVLFAVFRNPHDRMAGYDTAPLYHFVLTQLVSVPRFIGMWIWPTGQSLLHQPPLETSLWGWPLAGAALLAGLLALALGCARREPALAAGLLFFLLALSPTNSLLPLEDFFSERFLYLPIFGLALAAAVGLDRLRSLADARWGGRAGLLGWVLLALLPLAFGLAATARIQVWHDPLQLWSEAVVASPYSSRARVNLASELGARKRYAEALKVISPAVDFAPDEVAPRLNRAAARQYLGDTAGAIEDCTAATALTPAWPDAWECLVRAGLAARDCSVIRRAAKRLEALDPSRPLVAQARKYCGR